MSILAGAFGPSQSIGDPNHWLFRTLGMRTSAGVSVNEYRAMNMPAVYCAVGIVADNMAQLPLAVFRKTPDGAVQQDDHRLSEVLRHQPNPLMNSYNWVQTSQHHAMLWGNGYTEIQRNGKGEAIGFWQLLPDATAPQYNSVDRQLGYRTTISGESFQLAAEDVIHIKAIGFNGIVGYSPLTMMRQAVGMGLAMEEFGAKFFANDAKSGGFLMHPGRLGDEGKKNLAESMGEKGQGGLDNAHRVKVLEEGVKFISTMIPPEDAQFLGSRSFQVEEIARMYRIPLILMNSHEKMSVVGSSAEQLLSFFILLTVQPWLVQWEKEFNSKIWTEKEKKDGFFARFNLDALQRGDMAARANYAKSLFQTGAISPNEIRSIEGFNKSREQGMDSRYVPINFQTVENAAQAQPAPGSVVSPPGESPAEDNAND